jgi:8-oxo-dGTP diphosphatase
LLGQRSSTRKYYPNVWDMFGGHVEPGEEHEQTLPRELGEELGITPTRWTYLETINEPSHQLTLHLYLVTAWSGRPVNRQPDEHSAIGWFTLAQARQLPLAHPAYPLFFERYMSGS